MFSVLQKLGWFFAQERKRYSIAIILLTIVGFVDVVPPWLIGYAIDQIHLGNIDWRKLAEIIGWFGLITVASYWMSYYWLYGLFGGSFLVERILRTKLMSHLLKMTPVFYERNRTGDLMARATNDLRAVSVTTGFGILTFVDSTLFMGTIVLVMGFLISWKLTIAALLPMPIMAAAIRLYGKWIHERFTAAQDAFGVMNDQVLESVSGVRVVRAYVQEQADQARFHKLTEDVYRKNLRVARIDALFDPTIRILVGLSYLIGLGYGAYLVFQTEITLGELVSFNVYLGMLIWPMFAIGELINIMQRGNASIDRVNETLNTKPAVEDAAELVADLEEPGDIRFDRCTFRYPTAEQPSLVDVDFELKRGQTLGVVGRTGSGKTTLLKQLLRQYPLGTGRITIAGAELQAIPLARLKSWIGYVPQEQILFSRSIRDNIKFGKPDATEAELRRAIDLASLSKDMASLPEGLETMVGEKGVALSGGQKQRVSIARAIIADPEILILDDAMSAVDGKTEAEIIRHIREERQGKTTLISTHRLSAVQHADLILVMDEGRVAERGTHAELLRRGGWYKEQYERQQLEEAYLEGR